MPEESQTPMQKAGIRCDECEHLPHQSYRVEYCRRCLRVWGLREDFEMFNDYYSDTVRRLGMPAHYALYYVGPINA